MRHIHAGAIRTQEQFFVKAFRREVSPHAAIRTAIEKSFLQSLNHFLLSFEIGVAFVINFVEAHAQRLVCGIKAFVHPFVHLAPEISHFGVVVFPLHEHFASLAHQGSLTLGTLFGFLCRHSFLHELCCQVLYLRTVMLVEFHVIVSHKMVSLFAGTGRRLSVSVLEPSEHGLADVNSAVVHNVCLNDFSAIGLGYLRNSPAQQIVANVSEVQRLVCVGR